MNTQEPKDLKLTDVLLVLTGALFTHSMVGDDELLKAIDNISNTFDLEDVLKNVKEKLKEENKGDIE